MFGLQEKEKKAYSRVGVGLFLVLRIERTASREA